MQVRQWLSKKTVGFLFEFSCANTLKHRTILELYMNNNNHNYLTILQLSTLVYTITTRKNTI